MISIIVRTKNEERWIGRCLDRLLEQTYQDFEVILVDNQSTDSTIRKARSVYPHLKLVKIDRYRPGFAINEGVRAAQGEFIVCLSAHCLPVREDWLEQLLANFEDPGVAGVYGRQVPMKFSTPVDKRDLLVTFGLDRRVQQQDTFFHNANSMIRRDVWDIYPFDEEVTNIEDRVWGQKVINAGYTLVYEPEAAVYHYHGIHQNNDLERCESVVQILEDLALEPNYELDQPLNPSQLEIVALIPLRSKGEKDLDLIEKLVKQTIASARASHYIDRIIIATDSLDWATRVSAWGAEAPFLRPSELSEADVRADHVLKYSLEQLEKQGYFPDLVVPLEITYPFRRPGMIDTLIDHLLEEGLDTVIAGIPEYRPCWVRKDAQFHRLDDFSKQRNHRDPLHVGLLSLGCVTYPEVIRNATRLGERIGIVEIDDVISTIEIRDEEDLRYLEIFEWATSPWHETNSALNQK